MRYSSHRPIILRCFTMLVATSAIGLCLYAANQVEKAAEKNLRRLAQQDTQQIRQTLSDWVELRRQSLRGLATLLVSSDEVDQREFEQGATILRRQGDSAISIAIAYARVSPDHRSLKIIYSTETRGPLAQARELIDVPQAATLIRTAFPPNNHTVSSPILFDARDEPYAFMAYPLHRPGHAQELILTLIQYQDLFNSIASPEQGLALRVQITPPGGEPTFVKGDETPTAATLFTIESSSVRYGTAYRQYVDILPSYVGRQTDAERLAALIRYGGSLLVLIVMLLIWKTLDLYRLSLQREEALKEANQQIQDSEQHYRTLVDQVPGVVFRAIVIPKQRKIYFSPAVETLTGYDAETLLSSHDFQDLIAVQDSARVQAALDLAHDIDGRYEVEYRLIDRSGNEHWICERGQTFVDQHGTRLVYGVLIDISTHKAVELSLRSKVNLLRGIFDNAADVIIQGLTLDGDFRFWNKASERIFGWREDEVLGQPFKTFKLVSEDDADRIMTLYLRMAQTMQPPPPSEWSVRRRDGTPCVILATLFPIQDERDETMIVVIALDITEHKRIEASLLSTRDHLEELITTRTDALQQSNRELKQLMTQLVQAEKLASLGSLVAGIAHELNTPLGNNVAVASTLRQKVQDFQNLLDEHQLKRSDLKNFTQACDEAALLIEKSSQRASELIENFKQVAVDTTSTRRRRFDLKQTVQESIRLLLPSFKQQPHRIDIDIAADIEMTSYPGPLEQIIANLVINSFKHGFENRTDGVISIKASANDELVHIIYQDNGCGIPDALKRRVFDPFFTTKLGQGGSGLGLYIVFNLVHGVLGGQLKLSNAEGGGTCFAIELPRVTSQPQEASSNEQPAS